MIAYTNSSSPLFLLFLLFIIINKPQYKKVVVVVLIIIISYSHTTNNTPTAFMLINEKLFLLRRDFGVLLPLRSMNLYMCDRQPYQNVWHTDNSEKEEGPTHKGLPFLYSRLARNRKNIPLHTVQYKSCVFSL